MSQLQQALQVLAEAMRPDEQYHNADGSFTAKLNKLMATKAGRAKLRAALDQIPDDEEETDDDETAVKTNALRSPAALFAPPDPERHAVLKGRTTPKDREREKESKVASEVTHNSSDAPLGLPRSVLLAKQAGGAK